MNPTFDLEATLASWRAEFSSIEGIGPAEIAELETHLRESVEALGERGLSPEEAFLVARHRLGGGRVAEEMQQARPQRLWAARAQWMFLGVLGYHVFSSLLLLASGTVQMLSAVIFGGETAARLAAICGSTLSLVLFVWVVWQLAAGRWQLRIARPAALLRRPWVLGLTVVGMAVLTKITWTVQTMVTLQNIHVQAVGGVMAVVSVISWVEVLLMLVALVVASHYAERMSKAAR